MSDIFPGKARPSSEKLRGGYYTPEPIARFVANWVAEAGPLTLEPSAGDGAILRPLASVSEPTAVELVAAEARKASSATGVDVAVGDFFKWFTRPKHGAFDGVAGNPPYIRFGTWAPNSRDRAFELMRRQGLKPTRLTNAWMPFVVASLLAVRPGGRIGLVIPAELLQVDYASQIREYLIDHCSKATVVTFQQLQFDGVLQEVVLLLAIRGQGPARLRVIEVADASNLSALNLAGPAPQAPLHEGEKWTKYLLAPDQLAAIRNIRKLLPEVGDFARVNVGVVTGRNSFFCMPAASAMERGLLNDTIPLVSRSTALRSTALTDADIEYAEMQGYPGRLLAVAPTHDLGVDRALADYVALGEQENVHLGYKTSIRTPWWSVPSTAVPDGFMLRQVSGLLRLAVNNANATSTDTLHRVFTKDGVDMASLATAALNSATLAVSETTGRSYGGGLLEIEPREAVRLPIPSPDSVPRQLAEMVEQLLRSGHEAEAIDLVDQELLLNPGRVTPDELALVKAAHERLLNRRLKRGRSARRSKN